MMQSLIPISAIVALIIFLLKIWLERTTVKTAILTDMNDVVRRAKETYDYLEDNDHYWLKEGDSLNRYPIDVPKEINAYQALLPKLYYLGAGSLVRILAFYSHYQYCEGLKRSLFEHIKFHVEDDEVLSKTDVELLILRKQRICLGLSSIIKNEQAIKKKKLRKMPDSYIIPSTKEMSKSINLKLKQPDFDKFLK